MTNKIAFINKLVTRLFFIVLLIFVIIFSYPQILNTIVPSLTSDSIVLGGNKNSITLTPSPNNIELDFDRQIMQIKWNKETQTMSQNVSTYDPRTQAVYLLLSQFNSPLAPYADVFVTEADKNGNDWRLAVSITGIESGFGKLIPKDSYNAWGWRGGPEGAYSKFSSWEESITFITYRLAEGYGRDISPWVMEPIYCPPRYNDGTHAWARNVEKYMNILEEYRKELSK